MSARWHETGRDWDAERVAMSMPPSTPVPSCPFVAMAIVVLAGTPLYLLGHVIAWVVN